MRYVFRLYCFLLIAPFCSRAQPFSSINYNTKDGLPSGTVYDITQDANGFIWFATENGLTRFDGKNYKTFTTKDGLPDNSVLKVHGDKNGRVYFTPFTHGLYYYENGSINRVALPARHAVDLSTIIRFANWGDAICLTGLEQSYVLRNNDITALSELYDIKETAAFSRAYDSFIIAVTKDSLYYLTKEGKLKTLPISEAGTFSLIFDDSGQIHPMKNGLQNQSYVWEYFKEDKFFTYSGNVVNIFSTSTQRLLHSIPIEKMSDVFIDSENNLWIATLGNGVFRFPSFDYKTVNFGDESEIFSFARQQGAIMAGGNHSLIYQIENDKLPESYTKIDLSSFLKNSANPVSKITGANRIFTIYSDDSSTYIGADAFLLKQNRLKDITFKKIHPIKDIDKLDNQLLVSTGRNVLLLDETTLSVKDTLLHQRATCGVFYLGNYYIGTLGGLIKIDAKTKTTTLLSDKFPSLKGRITSIKRGTNNDLWITTGGKGLINFRTDSVVETVTEKDGLSSDFCTCIAFDKNVIWLGTSTGLNRIETVQGKRTIIRLSYSNGLGADFVNAIATGDSTVFVGTSAGLTSFSKNAIAERSECRLHLMEIFENGKPLKKDSVFSFPHNAMNIQIGFTAVSFKSAGDIAYYYRMVNLDSTWHQTYSNSVNFASLQPGTYHFYVKAVNKFGVNSDIKKITIKIRAAWWQTWWFKISIAGLLLAIVILIYKFNIQKIKANAAKEKDLENKLADLEQKAMQAQINPHFIFNALNSIQTYILNLDARGANDYLTRFASLIRQTLENSARPLLTLDSEIKYLKTYLSLEKLRFKDKFAYWIDVDQTINPYEVLLPGMLLQPYLENAIRHGIQHRDDNKGEISLNIRKMPNGNIEYKIIDNGVGRQKSASLRTSAHPLHKPMGTAINEKRIHAINVQYKINISVNIDDILNEDNHVIGTQVTLVIPPILTKL